MAVFLAAAFLAFGVVVFGFLALASAFGFAAFLTFAFALGAGLASAAGLTAGAATAAADEILDKSLLRLREVRRLDVVENHGIVLV